MEGFPRAERMLLAFLRFTRLSLLDITVRLFSLRSPYIETDAPSPYSDLPLNLDLVHHRLLRRLRS